MPDTWTVFIHFTIVSLIIPYLTCSTDEDESVFSICLELQDQVPQSAPLKNVSENLRTET